MRKTFVHFFTIADYEEEEAWLSQKHSEGWKFVKLTPPCFYVFEECEPEDVVYRMDYKNAGESEDYLQMMRDFGWEYFTKRLGWLYFRKKAEGTAEERELFSDDASRAEMAARCADAADPAVRDLPVLHSAEFHHLTQRTTVRRLASGCDDRVRCAVRIL